MFNYDDVLKAHPDPGDADQGEIQRLPETRGNPKDGPFGIVYQSPYLTIVRDPVLFPSYSNGTHDRLIQGPPDLDVYGVVILPIRPRPNGQEPEIALVRQYRYPRQGWMSEVPRGGVGSHERNSTGAVRELREETGLPSPDIMVTMDDLANDSGLSTTVTRYYMAVYMDPDARSGPRMGDSREAISDILWVPLSEWRAAALRPPVDGRPVGGLDAFTSAAVGLAWLTGTFSKMEVAWTRLLEKRGHDSPRLDQGLRDRVEAGDRFHDVEIRCRDEAGARAIRSELPLIDLKLQTRSGLTLTSFDVPALTIVWLSQHPAVEQVVLVDG